jgi:hypothetical protein
VIADLPNWMDAQFLRSASGALVVAGVLVAIVLVFIVRNIAMKLVSLIVIGAAIFGLVHYRSTLQRCDQHGCSCKLFGADVPGDHCKTGSPLAG